MIFYILRRLMQVIPLLLVLSFMVFGLFRLVPGDFLSEMEMNPTVSRERIEDLRHTYGLDGNLLEQYFRWIGGTLTGQLGYSFAQRRPVRALLTERLLATLILALASLLLALLFALPAGVLSALKYRGWWDRLLTPLSLVGVCIPTVLSSLFLLYLAYWTGWFPIGGGDALSSVVLPSVALAIPTAAVLYRSLRVELVAALSQPYVMAAAARGLPPWRVIWHGFRNAVNPFISLSGVSLGGLLSGAVVVEKVFGWPGLGSLMIDSILSRDLYVALNSVLASVIVVLLSNLLADLLLAWNDPRIRSS